MKNLSQNLDEILKSVTELKTGYQVLYKNNKELEVHFSNLKVEADQYKQEILHLRKELEEMVMKENHSMLLQTDNLSQAVIEAKSTENKSNSAKIQMQLDEFIEDIDQCIQIIQAKV